MPPMNPNTLQTSDPQERMAEEVRRINKEMVTSGYDQARSYTNLLLITGYAGAFAIWNFTREDMTAVGQATIALLLLLSLTTFVVFEVYKMTMLSLILMRHSKVLAAQTTPADFLREHQKYRTEIELSVHRWLLPIWLVSLVVSVVTALLAGLLLVFTFLSVLTGWP